MKQRLGTFFLLLFCCHLLWVLFPIHGYTLVDVVQHVLRSAPMTAKIAVSIGAAFVGTIGVFMISWRENSDQK